VGSHGCWYWALLLLKCTVWTVQLYLTQTWRFKPSGMRCCVIGNYVPNNTAPHPRICESSAAPLWRPQIFHLLRLMTALNVQSFEWWAIIDQRVLYEQQMLSEIKCVLKNAKHICFTLVLLGLKSGVSLGQTRGCACVLSACVRNDLMEQSPSAAANSDSARREILCHIWDWKGGTVFIRVVTEPSHEAGHFAWWFDGMMCRV
jgi:hypothetical protein